MAFHYLLLTLALLFPILLFIFSKKRRANNGLQLPPGPFAWPIVGNMFNLDSKNPHIFLTKLAQSLGPVLSLRFGSKLVIVASTPEAAREVFKVHDKEISGRFVLHASHRFPTSENSIITMAGDCHERWRFLRAMSHGELFSAQALESLSRVRVEKVQQMLQYLCSKEGEVVHIEDILFTTVINSFAMAMTSQDIIRNWENINEIYLLLRKYINLGVPTISDLYPRFAGLDIGVNQKVVDYIEVYTTLWGEMLKKRRGGDGGRGSVQRPDFVDVLIQKGWEDSQIVNILTEFIVSSETMTTTTEWVLAELTRNQEALSKLREELTEATKATGVLSESDLTNLPYLQACIKETFRLHPPLPFLVPRVAVHACKLMNYDVPKDSVVVANVYAVGRDPGVWKHPLNFTPERFLEGSIDVKGTNFQLLPFGGGRRICVGFPWALKQIPLLVASIVLAFDWSLPDGIKPTDLDMTDKFRIILKKEKPMLLIPRKRTDLTIH